MASIDGSSSLYQPGCSRYLAYHTRSLQAAACSIRCRVVKAGLLRRYRIVLSRSSSGVLDLVPRYSGCQQVPEPTPFFWRTPVGHVTPSQSRWTLNPTLESLLEAKHPHFLWKIHPASGSAAFVLLLKIESRHPRNLLTLSKYFFMFRDSPLSLPEATQM